MVWESSSPVRCVIPKLDRASGVKAPLGKDAGGERPTMRNREHALESASIVSTPHAGRLEGASDRPKCEANRPKTAPVASHCKSRTYRSVTWKDTWMLNI